MLHIMEEMPFILRTGETVVLRAGSLQYRGAALIADTIGGATAPLGVGAFGARTKQRKREGSMLDMEKATGFLTNERVVFARDGWRKTGLLAEFELSELLAMKPTKTLTGVAIEFAMRTPSGVDNITVVFTNAPKLVPGAGVRTEERDGWLAGMASVRGAKSEASTTPANDPMTELKMRFARGEISAAEYDAMRRVLQE